MIEKKIILVVDDTPENIDILSSTLKETYRVKAAISGKQALQSALKSPQPDLILLDIMMPDMDGYEVCTQLKANPLTASIPVIFVTAMNADEDESKGFAVGGIDYITKPISPLIVKTRLAMHLALNEQKQVLEQQVQEEIKKRLDKERLLIRQSRLAAMGEMMSAITHQWNQPLSIISTLSLSLQTDVALEQLTDESIYKATNTLDETVTFMSQTMIDFKNYFKPDKERESFMVKKEFEDISTMMNILFETQGISLRLNIDESLTGYGIPSEFKQVVLNLIGNARDVIKENMKDKHFEGEIEVNSGREGDMSIVTVGDNGGGIPVDIIDKIFDDYFTTKEAGGTGIGLSMSKMIMEDQMGGSISVENSPKGALFTLKFPSDETAYNNATQQ